MDERFMENAAALELLHREAAIAAVHMDELPRFAHFDGLHCIDCEDEIPAERRALTPVRFRCVECQRLKETGHAT